MIIKDAKRILLMVTEYTYLCLIPDCSSCLKLIIQRVAGVNNIDSTTKYEYKVFKKPETSLRIKYAGSPAFKSDRIFLLNEIIRYCEHRLNELSTTTNIKQ
jgi:hypothetical protein